MLNTVRPGVRSLVLSLPKPWKAIDFHIFMGIHINTTKSIFSCFWRFYCRLHYHIVWFVTGTQISRQFYRHNSEVFIVLIVWSLFSLSQCSHFKMLTLYKTDTYNPQNMELRASINRAQAWEKLMPGDDPELVDMHASQSPCIKAYHAFLFPNHVPSVVLGPFEIPKPVKTSSVKSSTLH